VRDHGPGLAREHIERVFDRFYQVPGDESRLRGSGLGLAIAKSVAGLHRGTIDVSNRPPGGCEFEVRMPVARP
jgi:two-component system phosphate regulon sensor histidine kinase PhoR